MTDRLPKEAREALIAGDRIDALAPGEAAELGLLADLLADESTWMEPSPTLEDAIVRAVADAEPEVDASVSSIAPAARKAAPRPRRAILAALAAAAAVAIAFGVVGFVHSGSSNDFHTHLSATGLAPGASASATVKHNQAGFRVTLDARGLPVLPPGEYYQAWLKNGAGVLVPIGSFSSSDAPITLWSGVSPADYPAISVTIEAADNNQNSSGRKVLVGALQKS